MEEIIWTFLINVLKHYLLLVNGKGILQQYFAARDVGEGLMWDMGEKNTQKYIKISLCFKLWVGGFSEFDLIVVESASSNWGGERI